MKKRIAVFLGGYLPAKKYGGPVTSIANFAENLGDYYDIFIVSNDHDLGEKERLPNIKDGWNTVGKAKVIYLKEKQYTKACFIRLLREIRADAVYLSSVFYYKMNFPVVLAAKKLGIPVVLAPRGELTSKALGIKWYKKKPYLLLVKASGIFKGLYFQATSEDELNNTARIFGCRKERVFLLQNLSPLPEHKEGYSKPSNRLRALTIARIVPNKNILYSVRLIKKLKSETLLDIYGPIEDREYWSACKKEIADTPNNIHISYKGAADPEQAKTLYLNYDCLILPTEFENYGQVIAEALLHDCPVIISRGTTPWDDVEEHRAGFAIPIGDDWTYVSALEYYASVGTEEFDAVIQNVRSYIKGKIDTDRIKEDYIEMFGKVIGSADRGERLANRSPEWR